MRVATMPALFACGLGLLAACGSPPEPEIPVPDSETTPAEVRAQLESQRSEVRQRIQEGSPSEEIGVAIGELGRLYHAYDFLDAARTCYLEAERLDPQDFRWPYCRGFLHQSRGELEEAAAAYERALQRETAHLPLLYRLAEVELGRGRTDHAEQLMRRAERLEPDAAAVHHGLGRVALARGEVEEAVRHLERALELEPAATKLHHPLGLAYRDLGDAEQARFHLERRGSGDVRLVDPPIAELQILARGGGARLHQAIAALNRGEVETALGELEEIVAADPEDLEAWRNLAAARSRAGDADGAVAAYRTYLEHDPEAAAIRLALGNLLAGRGDRQEAMAQFRAAVEAAPDFEQARVALGLALAQAGEGEAALVELDRALELDPQLVGARTYRAMTLADLGRVDEAKDELEALLTDRPDDVPARLTLVQLHLRERDEQAATRTLEQGLEATPAEARAPLHLELGRLAAGNGDLETALRHVSEAHRLDPSMLEADFDRGRLLLALGRPLEAAEALAAVTEQQPQIVDAWLGESEAWIRAGRSQQARERLQEGLQMLPEQPDLTDALARLLATSNDASVRDGEMAYRLAERLFAARQTPRHAETLAMALAEIGELDRATELQRSLVRSAAEGGADPSWRDRLQRNLQRYEEGLPARR